MEPVKPLAELLKERLYELRPDKSSAKSLTYRQAAERATRDGAPVSHGTLSNIVNSDQQTLKEPTVRALAALGIPREVVYQAIGVTSDDDPTPFDLPVEAQRLRRQHRKLVESVVQGLLDGYPDKGDTP